MSEPNLQILAYASQQDGSTVGDGQCWTLANEALKSANAKKPASTYTWGTPIALGNLKPGDIIQFANYKYKLTGEDGSWESGDRGIGPPPHHTAIVSSVGQDGVVEVYEQNVPDGGPVTTNTLYFKRGKVGDSTVSISGNFTFYRPVSK